MIEGGAKCDPFFKPLVVEGKVRESSLNFKPFRIQVKHKSILFNLFPANIKR
jgi:hypothetical protein